ncbi:MAG: NAD(P)-binding domain-containing protein [Herpetosiphonaceae bacterium]|nr:NAD(P)-binding domain-containing protein [Herpetosiphonaceae bacterium]
MHTEAVETIVIGGGQSGLAMSYYLTAQGRQHLVLEQAQVGESWRNKRWDSLRLVGPNWTLQLPGFPYQDNDADGFMTRDEIVAYLEHYKQFVKPPLREGVRVTAVEQQPDGAGLLVRTETMLFQATQVVVATGAYQHPRIPVCSANLPDHLRQLTPSHYRRPAALPPGAVLVVGSGESGCQIAEELRRSGRTVYLSVGRGWWVPRRYRGKDIVWWIDALGGFDQTVDTLPGGHAKVAAPGPQLTGANGGHDLNLHTLARAGVVLAGHLQGVQAGKLSFAPDLEANIASADAQAASFLQAIDDFVETHGLDVPTEAHPVDLHSTRHQMDNVLHELDLGRSNVTSIIWATGYHLNLNWIHLPVLDQDGYPTHHRGVSTWPGLYFLGFEWLYKGKSHLFNGVGDDAAYLAEKIAVRATATSLKSSSASSTSLALERSAPSLPKSD